MRTVPVQWPELGDGPFAASRMRYRLDVIAPNVPDAVAYVGGWLYDRAMAGWQVRALVAQDVDTRPLRILGVDTTDLVTALSSLPGRPKPHALAAPGDLCSNQEEVRRRVLSALHDDETEVTLWGNKYSTEVAGRVEPIVYSLSSAARAFKCHALAAAGAPLTVSAEPAEALRSGVKQLEHYRGQRRNGNALK